MKFVKSYYLWGSGRFYCYQNESSNRYYCGYDLDAKNIQDVLEHSYTVWESGSIKEMDEDMASIGAY